MTSLLKYAEKLWNPPEGMYPGEVLLTLAWFEVELVQPSVDVGRVCLWGATMKEPIVIQTFNAVARPPPTSAP